MNKARLTLAIFSLFSTSMATNICQANIQEQETQEFVLVKKRQAEKKIYKDEKSFSDYITLKNVAKATAIVAIAGATAGAGASLAMKAFGSTAVPTVATAAAVGAAGGGGALLILQALGWL